MAKLKTVTRHLVILHGWTLDPTVIDKWQPIIKLLTNQGFTVYFWPLPGLAEIPKKPLTLADYVTWLKNKTKSLKNFTLLGHSFGGQLAIRFTRLYPAKIEKLILVDSSGLIDTSLFKTMKRFVFKAIAKTGKTIIKSARFRRLLHRFARETDYYEAAPIQRETMKNVLAEEISADLSMLKPQTLIIWGKKDRVTPLKFGRLMAQVIPQAKLKIVDEARHSPIYTHPQVVAGLVSKFIKKI